MTGFKSVHRESERERETFLQMKFVKSRLDLLRRIEEEQTLRTVLNMGRIEEDYMFTTHFWHSNERDVRYRITFDLT